jgi:hypothetical protein
MNKFVAVIVCLALAAPAAAADTGEQLLAERDAGKRLPPDHYLVKRYASILRVIEMRCAPVDRRLVARVCIDVFDHAAKVGLHLSLEQVCRIIADNMPADGKRKGLQFTKVIDGVVNNAIFNRFSPP